MSRPVLYDYWRSSASYRVRIVLNLKKVDYESRPVNLLAGEQSSDEYRTINPQGLVPMLEIDGQRLTQSLAIINYLDLKYPNQPLLPASAAERARVLKYLKNELGHSQEEVDAWYRHWISERLPALEALAAPKAGKFMWGDAPTAADVLLVPQLYNARRFDVPLDAYPTLLRAEDNANKLDAFAAAHPDRQQVPA